MLVKDFTTEMHPDLMSERPPRSLLWLIFGLLSAGLVISSVLSGIFGQESIIPLFGFVPFFIIAAVKLDTYYTIKLDAISFNHSKVKMWSLVNARMFTDWFESEGFFTFLDIPDLYPHLTENGRKNQKDQNTADNLTAAYMHWLDPKKHSNVMSSYCVRLYQKDSITEELVDTEMMLPVDFIVTGKNSWRVEIQTDAMTYSKGF